MKGILRFTQALVLLALIAGCSGILEELKLRLQKTEAPVETLDGEKLDLRPIAIFSLPGKGMLEPQEKEYRVDLGARASIGIIVWVDNSHTDGESTMDLSKVQARLKLDAIEKIPHEEFHQDDNYGETELTVELERLGEIEMLQEDDNSIVAPMQMVDGQVNEGMNRWFYGMNNGFLDAVDFPSDFEEQLPEGTVFFQDSLADVDPELAQSLKDVQIPNLRYLMQEYRNHIVYGMVDFDGSLGAGQTHLLFEYDLPTGELYPGRYDFEFAIDPQDLIPEVDEDNNWYSLAEMQLEILDTGEPGETSYDFEFVDDCGETCTMCEVPAELDRKDHRVHIMDIKWYDSPYYYHWDHLEFWENCDYTAEHDMKVVEFWGPQGKLAEYRNDSGDWVRYQRASSASDIEYIFFFAAGGKGLTHPYFCTGQRGCEHFEREKVEGLLNPSFPVEIAALKDTYPFGPENTLMTMAFDHQLKYMWERSDHENIVRDWMDYFKDRTNNFENVRAVVLAGKSRGGILTTRIARLMQNWKERNGADFKVVNLSIDGVSYDREDHTGYIGYGHIVTDNGFWFIDCHRHDLTNPFGDYPQDFKMRIIPSNGMIYDAFLWFDGDVPTMMHAPGRTDLWEADSQYCENPPTGGCLHSVPGNWLTQTWTEAATGTDYLSLDHMEIGTNWEGADAEGMLDWMLEKAGLSPSGSYNPNLCEECSTSRLLLSLSSPASAGDVYGMFGQQEGPGPGIVAQKIMMSSFAHRDEPFEISHVSVNLKHVRGSNQYHVKIFPDRCPSQPCGDPLATSQTLTDIGERGAWHRFFFPHPRPELEQGEYYWIVVETAALEGQILKICPYPEDDWDPYPNGEFTYYEKSEETWRTSSPSCDLKFEIHDCAD